jgi:hypothetical protein
MKAKREIVGRESQDSLDRRELARAKKRNGGKSGVNWVSSFWVITRKPICSPFFAA